MGIKQLPLVQIECDRIDSEIPPGKIRFERALRHTGVLPWGWIDLLPCTGQVERQAVDHQANPIVESVLLRYPEIIEGRGPYPSVEVAMKTAAANVDNVYRRYNEQVASWLDSRGEAGR